MIEVRRAVSADWLVLRDVRLRALADSPPAFASTLEREVWRPTPRTTATSGTSSPCGSPRSPGGRRRRPTSSRRSAPGPRTRADTVTLWVADGNGRARRFYERLGFEPTGERKPLPSNPEIGEELMRRSLRA